MGNRRLHNKFRLLGFNSATKQSEAAKDFEIYVRNENKTRVEMRLVIDGVAGACLIGDYVKYIDVSKIKLYEGTSLCKIPFIIGSVGSELYIVLDAAQNGTTDVTTDEALTEKEILIQDVFIAKKSNGIGNKYLVLLKGIDGWQKTNLFDAGGEVHYYDTIGKLVLAWIKNDSIVKIYTPSGRLLKTARNYASNSNLSLNELYKYAGLFGDDGKYYVHNIENSEGVTQTDELNIAHFLIGDKVSEECFNLMEHNLDIKVHKTRKGKEAIIESPECLVGLSRTGVVYWKSPKGLTDHKIEPWIAGCRTLWQLKYEDFDGKEYTVLYHVNLGWLGHLVQHIEICGMLFVTTSEKVTLKIADNVNGYSTSYEWGENCVVFDAKEDYRVTDRVGVVEPEEIICFEIYSPKKQESYVEIQYDSGTRIRITLSGEVEGLRKNSYKAYKNDIVEKIRTQMRS